MTDSTGRLISMPTAQRRTFKKNRVTKLFEVRDLPPSGQNGHGLHIGGPGDVIVQVVASGWAFEDGLPDLIEAEIRRVIGSVPVAFFLFAIGVNSLNHGWERDRSDKIRASFRNLAVLNFENMVAEVSAKLSPSCMVYLGTTGVRRRRTDGDEGFFFILFLSPLRRSGGGAGMWGR